MDPLGLIPLARTLVDIDSTTWRESDCSRWLAAYLRHLGWTVEELEVADGRANVLAILDPPQVILSTHFDCVPPFIPSRVEGGMLYGRGSCDAKGMLAAQIQAAERLRAAGERRVGMLFLVGEERGSDGFIVRREASLARTGLGFAPSLVVSLDGGLEEKLPWPMGHKSACEDTAVIASPASERRFRSLASCG